MFSMTEQDEIRATRKDWLVVRDGAKMRLDGETVGRTVKRTYATRNEAILREPEDFWPLVQRCAL